MMIRAAAKDTLIASFLFCLLTFGVAYARDPAPSGNSVQRPDHSSAPSGPVLRVPETVFDFGLVIGEDEVVHEFPVFNAGTDTLKIEEVIAGWGCIVAHFDKAIPPGGEGKITIRFNLRGAQGAVEKTSIVVTNDLERPHFTLVLKGQIED